jgi:predicted Zn finger-like uncharacterized protein
MSMFTTCPNCKLHLAVTAMDLRIGQGYVRCGRCDRVFNALLSLAEDVDREQQPGLIATGTTTVPALEETDDALNFMPGTVDAAQREATGTVSEKAADLLLEDPVALSPELDPPLPPPTMQVDLAEPEPAPAEPDPDDFTGPDEWSKVSPIRPQLQEQVDVVETMATGTFETIVLEGDTYLQTEEHVDETEVDAQIQQIASQFEGDELADVRDTLRNDDADVEVEEMAGEEVIIETDDPELDADRAVGNAPRPHWAWTAAAVALAMLLLGQVVHHSRQSLVSRAWAERPLRTLYSLFGVTLEPRWDLAAYDLRQLGGEAMAGDASRIVLRATVQNRATSSQPPPMIRVTLQDRFGNALSTTAVAPQDYLRGAAPSRIGADQRLDAELTLDDPNRQAVGFELDACLPDAAGRLHCSNDP